MYLTRNKNYAPLYSITLLTSRPYYYNEGDFKHLEINRIINALYIEKLATCMTNTVSGIKMSEGEGRSDTKGMDIKPAELHVSHFQEMCCICFQLQQVECFTMTA